MAIKYRDIFESLLPPGSLWKPEKGGGLDAILEGQGLNAEYKFENFKELAYLKDPYKTPMLEDLEREYGIRSNTALAENVRREQLASVIYAPDNNGSPGHLKQQLDIAGFTNLQVHNNSPVTDPNNLFNNVFEMMCGQADAQCGEPAAQCGSTFGELVVNGDLYDFVLDLICCCGDTLMQCGESTAMCGNYTGTSRTPIEIDTIPDESDYWPFVFFIGGDITIVGDEITNINFVDVPFGERDHLRKLIVKYKPLGTWCALLVNYV